MSEGRLGCLVSQYPAVSHTFVRREIEALRRRGLEVVTFSIRPPPPDRELSEKDLQEADRTHFIQPIVPLSLARAHLHALRRCPVRYLRTIRIARRHRLPGARSALWAAFHFAEAAVLARALEAERISHLHVHFSNAGATVAMLASHLAGIGWSLTVHGSADFDGLTRHVLHEKIENARFVACVSDYGRAQAMRLSEPTQWPKMFVARCGIDLASFSLPSPKRGQRRLRVLCVGRLAPEKGHVGLVESFRMLVARGVDAELRIVGEGSERSRIEAAVAGAALGGRCQLVGSAREEDVISELSCADIFALSSLSEGLPVVLMEAMAAGVPVVAPRLAGIPELVVDGITGLTYTVGRWDQLAQTLAALAADPDLRERLASAGRLAVARDHDVERAIEPLWEHLRRAVG